MSNLFGDTSIKRFTGEYKFLSNFYYAKVVYDEMLFETAEHAFQAAKTNIPRLKKFIQDMPTPGKAKAAGRGVILREDWELVKFSIMREIVKRKFEDPELALKLKATEPSILIEGNTWHDLVWGVCTCPEHQGKGQNLLGQILMLVRDDIRTIRS